MGIRVLYFHGAAGGLLADFVTRPLQDFAAWLGDALRSFPEEIDPALPDLLRDTMALAATDVRSSWLVDRLIDLYYAGDWSSGACTPADGSCLRLSWYEEATPLLQSAAASPHALLLWSYLFMGRPDGRDTTALPYRSADGVFHVGYWTDVEIGELRAAILEVSPKDPHTSAWAAMHCAERAMTAALIADHGLIFTVG